MSRAAILLVLSLLGTSLEGAPARRVLLARWVLGRVDGSEAAEIQEALAGEIAATWQCSSITFSQASDALRREGFEIYETCRDIPCAAFQAQALGCTHAVFGSLAGMGHGYRLSLKLVDARTRESISRCDRVLEGSREAILTKGIGEIAAVLCHGRKLPAREPLVVREVISDRGRERMRLIVGIATGAALAAATSIAVIKYSNSRKDDEPTNDTSPVVFEW
jgi:hypothetical protein